MFVKVFETTVSDVTSEHFTFCLSFAFTIETATVTISENDEECYPSELFKKKKWKYEYSRAASTNSFTQ